MFGREVRRKGRTVALALYRKYRPRTFDEVIGQEHVTAPLIQALRNGKLNHAYLFSGPRGCGKTTSARILARSLNCAEGPTPDPCGVCDSCVALAPDGSGSLDVLEIDAASHGGVDDARELRERAFFAPVSSRFKVYIVDEAHMVSSAGFNALLKLVEEPPEYIVFIFATTEPEKVLQTIRSRTHHYPFRLVSPSIMRGRLEKLCAAEGASVEPAVFPVVVKASGGSMRDAESVLDQLLAGAGPEGITYERAVSLLGVTDSGLLDEMCDALAAEDGAAVLAAVDRVVEAGHDPRRFASDLLERLRDLIVLDRVPDAANKGLVDASADSLDAMSGHVARLGTSTLTRMADIVHEGLVQMRGTTSPRLLLELVCARMLLPAADGGHTALLQRLERLERRLEAGGMPAPAGPPASAPLPRSAASSAPVAPPPAATQPVESAAARPVPQAEPAVPAVATAPAATAPVPTGPVAAATPVVTGAAPAAGLDAAAVRRMWDQIVEAVKHKRAVWSLLKFNATVSAVDGDVLVLTLPTAPLARRLGDSANAAVVTAALRNLLGVEWTLRCEVVGESPSGGQPVRPPESDRSAPRPAADRTAGSGADWPEVRKVGGRTDSPPAVPADSPAGPATRPISPAPAAARQAVRQPADQPAPPARTGEQQQRPVAADSHTYEGFDPGDEPLDDTGSEPATRRDPEAEALALVQQTLGGRMISES